MRLTDTTPAAMRELWANCVPRIRASQYLEDVAASVVDGLYDRLADSLVMARAFMTIPFQSLPERQRVFATKLARSANVEALLGPHTPVLSLLATRGSTDDWNNARKSRGHLAIPLASEAFVDTIPMLSHLLKDLGLPLAWIQDQGDMMSRWTIGHAAGCFLIEDARTATDERGRKIISMQDFVSAHAVKSVFAVGGGVFGGAVIILIMFSRDRIEARTARTFMPLVNLLKGTMISRCSTKRVFRPDGGETAESGQPTSSQVEMDSTETDVVARLESAVGLVTRGALMDARLALMEIASSDSPPLTGLAASLTLLAERLTESVVSNESALATIQFSMLELETMQVELREKEARYRELFENMSDCVIVFEAVDGGQDFVFTDANAASLKTERLGREEMVGRRVTDLFPGVEEFGLLDVLRRVHRTGAAEYLPARQYQDQRISGWRENFIYRLAAGEVIAVYRDVTAARETELELRSQQRFQRALLVSIPSPVFYEDVQGRYLGCNKAFEDLLGKSEREIVGRTSHEVSPDQFAATLDERILAVMGIPSRQQYERQFTDAQGQLRDLVVFRSTFQGDDGRVAGIVSVLQDLTERRRLETDLLHAQKLKAVGQLASGIAHEINTPAQFVGDSVQFLQEAHQSNQSLIAAYRRTLTSLLATPGHEALAREIREAEAAADSAYVEEHAPGAFERVLDGISRISTLVGAMKEFGHRDQREKSPADLNRALNTTLIVARNEYKYVADVVTEFGDLPFVNCHVSDLNQVFLNLLVNAAHAIAEASGKDGPRGLITVRTAIEGDRVRIDVQDTGCGIPPEVRDRVFEPFFTTKEVGKGTGQGLAIAHSIVVDRHQGALTFATEVGRGTTFTVWLPVNGEDSLAPAA